MKIINFRGDLIDMEVLQKGSTGTNCLNVERCRLSASFFKIKQLAFLDTLIQITFI